MSEAVFVDTNVLLRLLLDDEKGQSAAARDLFRAVESGEITVWTSDVAIAELIWVLTGPMLRRDRAAVARELVRLMELPRLHLESKPTMRRALDLFTRHPIDWVDAYHAALLLEQASPELYSFDRDFDRIPGLKRVERVERGAP